MSLPDEWVEAVKISENRMRDETPLEPVFATFCINKDCPAAKVYTNETPFGAMVNILCMFSKCIRRYPSKKELKLMK
jgi:hypothetical protein